MKREKSQPQTHNPFSRERMGKKHNQNYDMSQSDLNIFYIFIHLSLARALSQMGYSVKFHFFPHSSFSVLCVFVHHLEPFIHVASRLRRTVYAFLFHFICFFVWWVSLEEFYQRKEITMMTKKTEEGERRREKKFLQTNTCFLIISPFYA